MKQQINVTNLKEVKAILNDSKYRVRPSIEKVPKTFQGLWIGELFERLIRINEGEFHKTFKRNIIATLTSFSEIDIQNTQRFGHHEILLLSLQTDLGSIPFGIGAHECPGRRWAKVIALTIVDYLRMLPINKNWLLHYRYKDSPNAKVFEVYSDGIFTECTIKRHSKEK